MTTQHTIAAHDSGTRLLLSKLLSIEPYDWHVLAEYDCI